MEQMSGIASDITDGRLDFGLTLPDDPQGNVGYALVFGFGKDEAEAKQKAAGRGRVSTILFSGREPTWRGAAGDIAWEGVGPLYRRGTKENHAIGLKLVDYTQTGVKRCLERTKR